MPIGLHHCFEMKIEMHLEGHQQIPKRQVVYKFKLYFKVFYYGKQDILDYVHL